MCIIICKPSDKELPDKQTLKNCFLNNSDGAGFSYVKDNRIYLSKGYSKFKPFYRALKSRVKKENPAILHFRIASIGEVSQQNCHPFLISECKADINRTELCTSHPVFAHNGNLAIKEKSGKSDTRQFARFLGDPILRDNLFRNNNLMRLLKSAIGYSRMAFMNRKGNIRMIGDFEEDGGLYFSNRTYKYRSITYRKWDEDKHAWIDDEEEEEKAEKAKGNKLFLSAVSGDKVADGYASNYLLESRMKAKGLEKLAQGRLNGGEFTERYFVKNTKCEICDKVGSIFYYVEEDMSLCDECYDLYCRDFENEEEVVNSEKKLEIGVKIIKKGGNE